MLTGVTPPDSALLVTDDDLLQTLPASVSASVATAIHKAMQIRRKDRPQTIAEFRAMLEINPQQSIPAQTVPESTIDKPHSPIDESTVFAGENQADTSEKTEYTDEQIFSPLTKEKDNDSAPISTLTKGLHSDVVDKSNSDSNSHKEKNLLAQVVIIFFILIIVGSIITFILNISSLY